MRRAGVRDWGPVLAAIAADSKSPPPDSADCECADWPAGCPPTAAAAPIGSTRSTGPVDAPILTPTNLNYF